MKTSMNYSIRQSQPQWNSQRKPLLQPQRQTQRQPQRSSQRQPQQSFQRQSNQNKPQNYPKRSSISGTQRTLKDSRQPRGQRLLYSMMRRRRLIKRIFIVLLLYLIVLGIALYFILREPDYCYTESTPSEYQITLCERQKDGAKCSFSVSQCSDGCLLGYRANYYNCPSTCDCAVEGKFENDVRFNPNNIQPVLSLLNNQEDNSFNLFYEGASDIERFWLTYPASTRYRIPYVYSNDVSNTTKDAIDKAIDILSAATCIDFYFRQTEVDYVEFSSREFGCSAFVGRIGGRQTINIGKGCEHPGTILHQMVHTLGFWHEQGRYDRDDHVQIVFGNVANENEIHFSKHKSTFALNYSYDVKSIMHSYGYFYSQNDWPTILDDETTSAVATQRESLTETDIKKINSLYMCKTDEFHSDSLPGDGWGKWSPWQSCSSSCGKGEKVRVRKCLSKAKNDVYSGRCPGSYHEQEDCEAKACSQGMWDEWSSCSTSCGPGVRHRTSCCTPHAKYEEEPCVVVDCPKSENQWGEWTLWQICSRSCGTGYRRRSRECLGKNFVKLNATDCSFTAPGATHYAACATKSCNVKSGDFIIWLTWESWSECSAVAGEGKQTRSRKCQACNGGQQSETRVCKAEDHISGKWGDWTRWASCGTGCTGTTSRSRTCYYKHNQIVRSCEGGTDGQGMATEVLVCTAEVCKKIKMARLKPYLRYNRTWSEWGKWGACPQHCGIHARWRYRDCMRGEVKTTGCRGKSMEAQKCKLRPCKKPRLGIFWGNWGSWSECPVSCGTSIVTRHRSCLRFPCEGNSSETRSCPFSSSNIRPEPCERAGNLIIWSECDSDIVTIQCSRSSYYHAGNFNDDSFADVACVEPSEIIVYTGAEKKIAKLSWRGSHSLCGAKYVENTLVGDFNGDGYDDLACPHEGHLTVLHCNSDGTFTGQSSITFNNICHPKVNIYLGYMDRDLKIDVICGSLPIIKLPEKIIFDDKLFTF